MSKKNNNSKQTQRFLVDTEAGETYDDSATSKANLEKEAGSFFYSEDNASEAGASSSGATWTSSAAASGKRRRWNSTGQDSNTMLSVVDEPTARTASTMSRGNHHLPTARTASTMSRGNHLRSVSVGEQSTLSRDILGDRGTLKLGNNVYGGLGDTNEEADTQDEDAKATPLSTVICIIANVVGAGLLSLPWTFCEASIVTGSMSMIITAILNWGAAFMIATSAEILQVFTYREIGEQTLGIWWGKISQAIMGLYTFGSCVTYLVLLGDFIPNVMDDVSDNDFITNRPLIIIFISAFVLLPLALLKDLSSLRHTSTASLVCIAYAFGVILIRAAKHSKPITAVNISTGVLQAFPIINVSFTFHYNVPRFYRELRPEYRNLKMFGMIVATAFSVCLILYLSTATLGYYAFGADTKGDVLKGFSESDTPALVARVGLGITMAFIYPLSFHSLRTTVFALAPKFVSHLRFRRTMAATEYVNINSDEGSNGPENTEQNALTHTKPVSTDDDHTFLSRVVVTLIFLTATVIVAISVPEVEVVLGYKGALFGSCIVYIFPSIIYCILTWQHSTAVTALHMREQGNDESFGGSLTPWINAKSLRNKGDDVGDPEEHALIGTTDGGETAAKMVQQVRDARTAVSPWKNLSTSCLVSLMGEKYCMVVLFYLVWGLLSVVVGTIYSSKSGSCPHDTS